MTKAQRRKVIAKRNAALKSRATWARKKLARGEPEEASSSNDFGGVPESDAMLDELPDSLVG